MARRFPMLLLAALLLAAPGLATAAGPSVPLQRSGADVADQASLQRGARLYMNYCAGCHSLKFVRYNALAEALGLTEAQVAENLQFTGDRPHDLILSAMPAEESTLWFGMAPPDLSLTARARSADWIYTFLKSFYADPESALTGANNTVLVGTAMPHVLWDLQGVQEAVFREDVDTDGTVHREFEGFELTTPGLLTPDEFGQAARDLTAFLSWAAEPMQLQRQRLGIMVLLFLFVLFVFSYLFYKELWKDVK